MLIGFKGAKLGLTFWGLWDLGLLLCSLRPHLVSGCLWVVSGLALNLVDQVLVTKAPAICLPFLSQTSRLGSISSCMPGEKKSKRHREKREREIEMASE